VPDYYEYYTLKPINYQIQAFETLCYHSIMKHLDFNQRILVGITSKDDFHWPKQMAEVAKFKITEVSLFLEKLPYSQRKKVYQSLLKSKIKSIPLVHLRHDMSKEEIEFLVKNYQVKFLTIHEINFNYLKQWQGYYSSLFLEMNADDRLSPKVEVEKIGGFCVDLSHFKKAEVKFSREFAYILKRKDSSLFFRCNHLNGYSPVENADLHTIISLKDFDYLTTLPKFLFSNVIALEVENSIADQLKFKKYLAEMLNNYFQND